MASRALGTLTLDLLVKMDAFQEGMDRASRVAVQNSKKIQQAMANVEVKANRFANSLKSAFPVVGATFNNFITQTSNAENEQAQLAAVLKSTGEAAGWTQQQLNKMAEEMSSTAGGSLFSVGDITQAQTRLLSYSNIVGQEFPQAMQATIDMASRMGMSVTQAAETIGEALDVPSEGYSALTKQGFRFTAEQKRLIEEFEKTGQAAEAQKIILDVLSSSYDGAAKASRDTLGGSLKALNDSINTLMTGDMGSVNGLQSSIDNLVKTINSDDFKKGFSNFISGLIQVAEWSAKATSGAAQLLNATGYWFASLIHGSDVPLERLIKQSNELNKSISDTEKRLESTKSANRGGRLSSVISSMESKLSVLKAERDNLSKQIEQERNDKLNPTNADVTKFHTEKILKDIINPGIQEIQSALSKNLKTRIVDSCVKGSSSKLDKLLNDPQKEVDKFNKQIDDLTLTWMELNGQMIEASSIRFDRQYEDLRNFLTLSGRFEDLGLVDQVKQMQVYTQTFSQNVSTVSDMFKSLSIAEQMLSVSQKLDGVGELSSLAQLGKLRRGQFEELTIQFEKLKEVINSGDATPKMIEDFRQLDLQLKQLQVGLDPLGAKFADVFSSAMEGPLFDFLQGTKSASEAFESMINKMITDLGRLAMQDALSRLFKSMGGGSGFFSYLGGLFGNAKGGVYSSPGLSAYSGQIVSQPTVFAFAKGAGLMGEAGPEAIMPLTRSANGELAVKAVGEQLQKDGGKSAINISNTVNVTSSGTSVSTQSNNNEARYQQLNRGIEEAVRQVIAREMRQGGILWKGR